MRAPGGEEPGSRRRDAERLSRGMGGGRTELGREGAETLGTDPRQGSGGRRERRGMRSLGCDPSEDLIGCGGGWAVGAGSQSPRIGL